MWSIRYFFARTRSKSVQRKKYDSWVKAVNPLKETKVTRSGKATCVSPYRRTLALINCQGKFGFYASSNYHCHIAKRNETLHDRFMLFRAGKMFLSHVVRTLSFSFFPFLNRISNRKKSQSKKNVNECDKTEDRQITKLWRTEESTKRFQDHIVLVAEINWRRLGDRRTAGLGLAAVRHHWLTQRLPSLSNLFLCTVPLALPALCLSLSFYPVFSLFSLPRSCPL